MKAFISYSHKDEKYLERFHIHLAQLKRRELISTWTDQEILAGAKLDDEISQSLGNSNIFIALISPDYISSNYCYEREFETALKMHENGEIIIVPVIAEDCDWKNTPFQKFKALPNDGNAISNWSSESTAFLNVIQEIEKLLDNNHPEKPDVKSDNQHTISKNYKIKKDFDSIQKIEFQEKTFEEVRKILSENISELGSLDKINAKVTISESKSFKAILVNRNMIGMESILSVDIKNDKNKLFHQLHNSEHGLNIILKKSNGSEQEFSYSLSSDEYNLFWKASNYHSYSSNPNTETEKLTSKQITKELWGMWLNEVGIEL